MSDKVISIRSKQEINLPSHPLEERWFAECMRYLGEVWDEADCHVHNEMISDLRQLIEKYQREAQGGKQ